MYHQTRTWTGGMKTCDLLRKGELMLGLVTAAYNANNWELKATESEVQDYSWLLSEFKSSQTCET